MILEDIMKSKGWNKEQLRKELDNRETVLQYLVDNNIENYRDFSLIIRMYTSDPETVISAIKNGKILPLEIE